jgi:Double-GTPase 2
MPVLVFLLIVVGIALYLAYVIGAVPLAAVCSFAVYGAGMPIAYLAGLGQVLVLRPPSLTEPRRWPTPAEDADPAVLQYFYGPALADAEHAVRVAYGNCRGLWRFGGGTVQRCFTADAALLTWPLGGGAALGMVAGTVLGAAATAGCAFVHLLTVGLSATCVRIAGTVLRCADSAVLRIKNIRMVCPHCGERITYPAYECPSPACTKRHRDIRPGRFGILRRYCDCGEPMATLLLFGSSRMNAYCPYENCGEPLEYRPGKWPETVLPFFGAVGAGKTRLLFSMARQLTTGCQETCTAEFGDSSTADQLRDASKLLSPKTLIRATPPAQLPRAYIIRLTSGDSTQILHMFDAAGEYFYSPERTQELQYLSKADTFVLVIDPLSVEAFWDRLLPDQQSTLEQTRSTALTPELAYQHTHQELEGMGIELGKARLAVVFSRADLIKRPDDDVASWATKELGLGNLVRSARLSFGEVRFFRTAAVIKNEVLDESIPALLRWVLPLNGMGTPGDSHG